MIEEKAKKNRRSAKHAIELHTVEVVAIKVVVVFVVIHSAIVATQYLQSCTHCGNVCEALFLSTSIAVIVVVDVDAVYVHRDARQRIYRSGLLPLLCTSSCSDGTHKQMAQRIYLTLRKVNRTILIITSSSLVALSASQLFYNWFQFQRLHRDWKIKYFRLHLAGRALVKVKMNDVFQTNKIDMSYQCGNRARERERKLKTCRTFVDELWLAM